MTYNSRYGRAQNITPNMKFIAVLDIPRSIKQFFYMFYHHMIFCILITLVNYLDATSLSRYQHYICSNTWTKSLTYHVHGTPTYIIEIGEIKYNGTAKISLADSTIFVPSVFFHLSSIVVLSVSMIQSQNNLF